MRTAKKTQREDSEAKAAFAAIPMEKLSGLDETLWLEQMSSKKFPKSSKKSRKLQKKC